MTTFVLCMLAGFGASWLFAQLRRAQTRVIASSVLLAALCYELRCFPHPIEKVWGADDVPAAVRFAASLPERDLIASYPLNTGRVRFGGDAGLTLHNYLALYHRHRFVNGQSSWQPPVTEFARRVLDRLPDEGTRRALLSIGARHLIIFGDDLPPEHANLTAQLAARPSEYRRVFQQGADSVFTLLGENDPTLELLEPPALPAGAELIPEDELHAHAALEPERAQLVFDQNEDTFWSSGRVQARGQAFEVQLSEPHAIVALEIDDPGRVMDAPVSYRLSAGKGAEDLGVIAEQSVLRFYRAQIFSPERFVFRVVLPRPITADRLRITVEQPVPGHYWAIHELRLYAAPAVP